MSSPRVVKILSSIEENLKNLGNAKPKQVAFGTAQSKYQAVILDLSKASGAAWATGDLRAIVVAIPAGANETDAMKTQSHAAGLFIDGSVSLQLWMESLNTTAVPTSTEKAYVKFQQDLIHALRGQFGAPVELFLTAEGTQPTVDGLDGAVANVGASVAFLAPYGRNYVGGI